MTASHVTGFPAMSCQPNHPSDSLNAQCLLPSSLRTLNALQVSGGLGHVLALASSGRLFSWGWNAAGQLGLGSTFANEDIVSEPCQVDLVSTDPQLTLLGAARVHSIATHCKPLAVSHTTDNDAAEPLSTSLMLRENLRQEHAGVFVWGSGRNGRLGLGLQESCNHPQELDLRDWACKSDALSAMACGSDHTCLVLHLDVSDLAADQAEGR